MTDRYLVSPSPHIHAKASTDSLMRDVLIALLPVTVAAILFYGWSELLVLGVSLLSCALLEWAIAKWMMHDVRIANVPSALVTGLLLALNLPATAPWWVVFAGAVFAIGITKMSFGGLGQNIFNPAIAARVFLLVSFPKQMTVWAAPNGFLPVTDAISGATLLGKYNEGGMEALRALGYPGNHALFFDMGGSVGEISAGLLLLGFAYLLLRKVVKPWIPLSIFATIALISGIFHGVAPDTYTGPVLNLLAGGVILGACFMATDYVTSPMSAWGGVIYGAGIGFIVMMIRYFGSYPEGMSFAILIMNCFVPLIDRAFHQKKYGRG
ncbi:MAG: RnfABCDGE type electron transport complex subunit D [Bacteroidales bacterium]|nr:RnfABCDGE type electron transport complex subunit D [Bacteroidales bacterium]